MKLCVARVEDNQADEDDHVGETVERGIQKTAKPGDATRKTRYLPVEHVKQIGDNQDDASPEEVAVAEKQPAPDVDGDADDGEQVRVDPA
ncbi:MAG: hypothetical protein H7Y06_07830 [Opitutaceae bacterium]|nr:hypothetical protein [Opitutaceae bacterium]